MKRFRHNAKARTSTRQARLLDLLAFRGALALAEIYKEVPGKARLHTRRTLAALVKRGDVVRNGWGIYDLSRAYVARRSRVTRRLSRMANASRCAPAAKPQGKEGPTDNS